MTSVRTLLSIAALTFATLATPGWAASNDQDDSHHPAQATAEKVAPATPAMGMRAEMPAPAHAEQMKAMQEMHEQMLAAKTPEERNALMAAQMALMQKGMSMMGGMGGMRGMNHTGGGAMMDKPGDVAARQEMMHQHMDMMQSMMQLMMDRMQSLQAKN